jgi:beta-lactamase regulating signal transducer with metallopeptidase domain
MQLQQILSPVESVLPFLVAIVAQVTILAGATLMAFFFLRRRPAAVRHAVLLTGLVAILMAPAIYLSMEVTATETIDLHRAAAELGLNEFRLSAVRQIAKRPTVAEDAALHSAGTPAAPGQHQESVVSPPSAVPSIRETWPLDAPLVQALLLYVSLLVGVWLIGVVIRVCGFVRGCAAARSLINGSCPVDDSAINAIFAETSALLSVAIRPRLLQSSVISSPLVVGLFRPAIVLPKGLEQDLDPVQLRSVLLHEMAHILRHDNLVGLLQRIISIVWWPHPLMYCLNRHLSQAREEICDNYALTYCEKHEYARTLLQMSTRQPTRMPLAATIGLLPPRWRLEDRVQGFLEDGRILALRVGRLRAFAILGVMSAGTLLLAGTTVMVPTEEETIQQIRSLGGSVAGPNGTPGGTAQIQIGQEWTGMPDALKQLKYIRGIKEIWFSGATIDEVVLEDLPDLEKIFFCVNFYDNATHKQVNWPSLPIKTIRLKNLPKIKSFDRRGGGNNLTETQMTTLALAEMDNVTNLQVEGSQLQDDVLLSLSGAPHLKDISANRPTSTRPGGHTQITDAGLKSLPLLKELELLGLAGARITDDGLKTIGTISTLEGLDVSASVISDDGLKHIASLSRLKALGVNETAVTDAGLKRIVAQHPKLRRISLGGSAVTASGLEALRGLPDLDYIELDSSQLTRQSCTVLSALPIRVMKIDGASTKPGHISSLPEVTILFVEGPENLTIAPGGLVGLKSLFIRGAGANATRSFFQHFADFQKLEQLEVSTGQTDSGETGATNSLHIDDELMQNVARLHALKFLWFSAARVDIGDKGIAAIAGLTSLEGILLPETKITDRGIPSFSGLVGLNRLRIGGEGITNEALVHLRPLKQLRELSFYNTRVDQSAADQLKADMPGASIQAYRMK